MTSKKHKTKPKGHYCRVCREYMANEKFSGKGHAAHICKNCMRLTPAERSERLILNKIYGMAARHLNESEIKWLRAKLNDKRPAVKEAAKEVHAIRFPHYECNKMKKGLTANSLEFFIHGKVWDENGDEVAAYMRFFAENTGVFRRTSYSAPETNREAVVNIGKREACKFLKFVVHELDALFWDEDLSDEKLGNEDDVETPAREFIVPAKPKKSYWSLHLMLSNGENKEITFYNQMHGRPQDLFWELMKLFEAN